MLNEPKIGSLEVIAPNVKAFVLEINHQWVENWKWLYQSDNTMLIFLWPRILCWLKWHMEKAAIFTVFLFHSFKKEIHINTYDSQDHCKNMIILQYNSHQFFCLYCLNTKRTESMHFTARILIIWDFLSSLAYFQFSESIFKMYIIVKGLLYH